MEQFITNLLDNLSVKTISSREISKLTGVRHDNVLRDIDKLNKSYKNLGFPRCEEGYYNHPNTGNQKHRCFNLTRVQTFDLITGYSRELRIKVIRRWEELEKGFVAHQQKKLPNKRRHNRLTVTRLNEIMRYVCMIENTDLRLVITDKLYENN